MPQPRIALNLKPAHAQPVKARCQGLDPGYRMGCKVAEVDETARADTAVST
jgi:uncharacterized protein